MDVASPRPEPTSSDQPGTPGRGGHPPTAGAVAMTTVVGLLLGVALAMGRRLWFFSDDWNILADYHRGNLLEPFNGHLSAVPAGLYQLLFHTVGMGSYLPYRLCGLAALGVLGFQVARYSSARAPVPVAVLATAAVMWNSAGATNVLFPFLMNFSLPIAAMVAIWWHLDRDSPGHDIAAGAWLALALATSGLGVMTLVAVVVELALRRAPPRRWAPFLPAAAAWVLWWSTHRDADELSTDVTAVAAYAVRMLWGGATALAAGSRAGGLAVGAGFAALVVVALRRRTLGPRAAAAMASCLAFAGLTALTRLDVVPSIAPDELRYGWTIGAYLVLAAVSMWPDPGTVPRTSTPGARGAALAGVGLGAVVLTAGAWQLLDGMGAWVDQVEGAAPGLRSVLYATEAAGPRRVDPSTVLPLSYVPVTTAAYLGAVADVGSPLEGAAATDIGGRSDQREVAERLFFDAVTPEVSEAPTAEFDPASCGAALEVAPGRSSAVVVPVPDREPAASGPVDVSRFSNGVGVRLRPGDPAVAHRVAWPHDAPVGTDAVIPYVLRVDGSMVVCRELPGP